MIEISNSDRSKFFWSIRIAQERCKKILIDQNCLFRSFVGFKDIDQTDAVKDLFTTFGLIDFLKSHKWSKLAILIDQNFFAAFLGNSDRSKKFWSIRVAYFDHLWDLWKSIWPDPVKRFFYCIRSDRFS